MEGFEKYKVVIYILLALLYFIFKGRKKQPSKTVAEQKPERRKFEPPKPAMESRPVSKPYREEEEPKFEGPVTLEDLLKGLGKEQEEKSKRETITSKIKPINYDENLEDEEEKYSKRKILFVEEKAEPITEEEFAPYVPEKNTENEYAAMFNSPENIRKVFVAQEIFTPKHF